MATEPQPEPPLDEWQALGAKVRAGRADVAPLGPRTANPLHLREWLDVLRRLQASGQLIEADDPVWDELGALGLVEMHFVTRGGSSVRCGMLTSLGRRYRTD